MRIISGTARGSKLFTLKGMETRPTLDRVRESVFNILQKEIQDSTFLDLFSGSGAIGLEAASRGAEKVVLCDKQKQAVETIRKNIEKTKLAQKIICYQEDYQSCLEKCRGMKFDLIYLDPPYESKLAMQAIKLILKYQLITQESKILIETDEEEKIVEQLKAIEIDIKDIRRYGSIVIIFVQNSKIGEG